MGSTEALVGKDPFATKAFQRRILPWVHQPRKDMCQNTRKFDLDVANDYSGHAFMPGMGKYILVIYNFYRLPSQIFSGQCTIRKRCRGLGGSGLLVTFTVIFPEN